MTNFSQKKGYMDNSTGMTSIFRKVLCTYFLIKNKSSYKIKRNKNKLRYLIKKDKFLLMFSPIDILSSERLVT